MQNVSLISAKEWLSYDIVRLKIELGVEEKFKCKNATKDATWRYARAGNSYSILLLDSVHRHTDAYADTLSRAECHSARLVLNGDNYMLGLHDLSNLLLVLSTEERRALLKLL